MSEVATLQPRTAPATQTPPSFNAMMPQSMGEAVKLAEMMSRGKLVPAHLQSSPGDCLMVIELAMRLQMSPFAVAQCTSVIQGKLMLEGKLAGAAINASGLLRDRLKYKYEGEGNARKITAWATLKGESEPSSVTVELAKVKTTNKMWDSQPDQQLVYSANRIWGRRFAPEVMLGVNAPEEFEGPMPAAPDNFSGVTLDAKAEPPQAARTPAAETKPKAKPPGEWLDELEAALAACTTADEVHAIVSAKGVQAAFGIFKNGNLTRLEAITAAADERFRKPADPPPAMSATADIDDEIPF